MEDRNEVVLFSSLHLINIVMQQSEILSKICWLHKTYGIKIFIVEVVKGVNVVRILLLLVKIGLRLYDVGLGWNACLIFSTISLSPFASSL
jgi:hypothetical protein